MDTNLNEDKEKNEENNEIEKECDAEKPSANVADCRRQIKRIMIIYEDNEEDNNKMKIMKKIMMR